MMAHTVDNIIIVAKMFVPTYYLCQEDTLRQQWHPAIDKRSSQVTTGNQNILFGDYVFGKSSQQ